MLGAEDPARQSAAGNRGDVAALCLGLESGRSHGVHERLRPGLAHQPYGERARAVRLAGAVRSLSEELLRPREVTRLALVRRAARARAHTRLRVCDGTIQTDARGFSRGERTIHAGAPETGRPLADSARSYIGRSEMTVGRSDGRTVMLCALLLLAGCDRLLPKDRVMALEGATLIDGAGGAPKPNALNLGSITGPRMFTAGAMIDGVPPTYANATGVGTADQARRAVDQHAVAGVDYLKVYTKITPALLRPLLDEADKLRLPVAAHLGKTDAVTAARAGVVSIEHMAGVVQAATGDPMYASAHNDFLTGWTAEEKGWAGLDSSTVARTARALAQTKVVVVPTLVVHDMLSRLDNPILLTRPGMEDVPENAESVRSVASLLRRTGWRPADFDAFRRSRRRQDQFVREFRRAGGAIAAGSDAANQLLIPGYSLHEEMSFLVGAGLTPLEAITAATRRGAQLLRADSLG